MPGFWKGKKIACFIALAHHTRFLLPIMKHLENKGGEVIYIVGQGENPQELTAVKAGVEYRHVFDYLDNHDVPEIEKNYLVLKDVISNGLTKDQVLGTLMITVIDKVLHSCAMEYSGFKNFLKKEKPDICFSLHELNRWGKMFAFHSKKENIPFITLQEGLGYDADFTYHGHVQYSTLCLVWGERIRKKLGSFDAPVDRIIPVGNTHLSGEINRLKKEGVRKSMRRRYSCSKSFVIVMMFPPIPPEMDELSLLFSEITNLKQTSLFIKWHPAARQIQIDVWVAALPEKVRKRIHIIFSEENTYDLMAMSDLVVLLQTSTTGLEALAMGKPVIELKFKKTYEAPYSFSEEGVAASYKPEELIEALEKKTDFKKQINPDIADTYLKRELSDNQDAVKKIEAIAVKLLTAGKRPFPGEVLPQKNPTKKWSVIMPVSNNAEFLLAQLEAVASFSEGYGAYEVILIEPENTGADIKAILDSLGGDVVRIKSLSVNNSDNYDDSDYFHTINNVIDKINGERMLILGNHLAPLNDWLAGLERGFSTHGSKKIFGARIIDRSQNLLHAGILLSSNCEPLSAFGNVHSTFAPALKEQAFNMVDHFIGIDTGFFGELGGFDGKTGRYAFLDLCLRARKKTSDDNISVYLPDARLMKLIYNNNEKANYKKGEDDAIFFYGRWHGELWENPDESCKPMIGKELQKDMAVMDQAVNMIKRDITQFLAP